MDFNGAATGDQKPEEDDRWVVVCALEGALIGRNGKRLSGRVTIEDKQPNPTLELKYNFELLGFLSDLAQSGARVIIAADTQPENFLTFSQDALAQMERLAGSPIDVSKFEVVRMCDIPDMTNADGMDIDIAFYGIDGRHHGAAIPILVSQDSTTYKFTTAPPLENLRNICGRHMTAASGVSGEHVSRGYHPS